MERIELIDTLKGLLSVTYELNEINEQINILTEERQSKIDALFFPEDLKEAVKGTVGPALFVVLGIVFAFAGAFLTAIIASSIFPNMSPTGIMSYLPLIGAGFGFWAWYKIVQRINNNSNQKDAKKTPIHQTKEYQAILNEYNPLIEEKKSALLELSKTEYAQMLGNFLPARYCTVDAISFFITAIENMRADILKEAINLYEDDIHKRKMEEMRQMEMDLLMESTMLMTKSLKTQQKTLKRINKISKQVRFGNALEILDLLT